ncbi:MAG: NAD(P)-dependent oxidoreductase [Bacillota bacterium]|nr:MAG: NAD(P)-dependent oxidoreductase [Bacillota bacterium]
MTGTGPADWRDWTVKPIVVTGAAGTVGSHVVRTLLAGGRPVVATDQLPEPGVLLSGLDRLDYRRMDICDLSQIVAIIKDVGPEVVIHMAALVGDWYNLHPLANLNTNLGGTLNMLEACRLMDVKRLVFASTWALYGGLEGTPHSHPEYKPVPEDMPPVLVRPYEIVKYSCERYAAWYRKMYGLEFAAVRFGSYYAAERMLQVEARSSGAFNDMIRAVGNGRPYRLEAGGDQGFDAVYVKDCAAGVTAAALAESTPSGVYNIGAGKASTLLEAAAVLRDLVPGIDISVGPGLLQAKHYCALDISRARNEIGYDPGFSLREGLADCLSEIKCWKTRLGHRC